MDDKLKSTTTGKFPVSFDEMLVLKHSNVILLLSQAKTLLIPLKLLGFNWNSSANSWDSVEGVNITLGIPIIRVSVDHGTAFDIAGTGKASDSSMVQAILYATKMANI